MTRVVVTGMGIVSSIGSSVDDVLASLRTGRSGMTFLPEMRSLGYRCCVFAPVQPPEPPMPGLSLSSMGAAGAGAAGRVFWGGEAPVFARSPGLPSQGLSPAPAARSLRRCLSTASNYGWAAAEQAVRDAGLPTDHLRTPRAGIVFGSGVSGRCDAPLPQHADEPIDSPFDAFRMLGCSPSAVLAYRFGCQGPAVSLSAACATGLYNIGHAFELVRSGLLDVCLTGSAEGEIWDIVGLSGDNSNGMPTDYNDRPEQACRPFDRDRQGFVMTAGAGALALESLEHARRRGAKIYAEVVGYGAANDGGDMFNPSGVGLQSAIEEAMFTAALSGVTNIDYINAHGTGTLNGDAIEAQCLAKLFADGPLVSSTKGQAGHGQGSAASQEAVFTLLMLEHGFVAPTKNLDHVAPECGGIRHVQRLTDIPLATAMTVNNGLGGVNACLVFRKVPAEN